MIWFHPSPRAGRKERVFLSTQKVVAKLPGFSCVVKYLEFQMVKYQISFAVPWSESCIDPNLGTRIDSDFSRHS